MRSAVIKDKAKDKNVVVCKLKKGGKRFEISINKDLLPTKAEVKAENAAKVINWDLVLSAPVIFTNAAKSEAAKPQDLLNAFPVKEGGSAKSDRDIFVEILSKGEVMLSEEQRAESVHKDKDHFAQVAAGIVGKVHIRPTEDVEEAGGKKKKKSKGGEDGAAVQRLGVFPQEEIERELKNAKFKPQSTTLADQVVEGIALLVHSVSLIRTQSAMTIQGAGAPDMFAVQSKFDALKPGFVLALPLFGSNSSAFKVIYDPAMKDEVLTLAKKCACTGEDILTTFLPTCQDEDLTFAKPEAALSSKERQARVTKREKKAASGHEEAKTPVPVVKAEKKNKKPSADSDDDAEATDLAAQLAALKADDSDDGGKKGKKGKKGKGGGGGAPPPQPKKQAPVVQAKKPWEHSDEDEDGESSGDEAPVQTVKPKKRR